MAVKGRFKSGASQNVALDAVPTAIGAASRVAELSSLLRGQPSVITPVLLADLTVHGHVI